MGHTLVLLILRDYKSIIFHSGNIFQRIETGNGDFFVTLQQN